MRSRLLLPMVLASALVLGGCTAGIIYSHTIQPLTVNLRATPTAGAEGVNDIKHIQLPYVGVAWGDTSLGDVARERGLQELYYADREYLSVLGIWQQTTVHLYGR